VSVDGGQLLAVQSNCFWEVIEVYLDVACFNTGIM